MYTEEILSVIFPSLIFCVSFAVEFYGCSPALMQAIMILQGKEPTWAEAKSQLGERQQRDEGMNKRRKLKGWKGIEPFEPDREEIGSGAKKQREKMEELECPKNEQMKT